MHLLTFVEIVQYHGWLETNFLSINIQSNNDLNMLQSVNTCGVGHKPPIVETYFRQTVLSSPLFAVIGSMAEGFTKRSDGS